MDGNNQTSSVVISGGRTLTYSAMLKDRDYDVTAHIFLILSLTLTQNARGGSAKVCEVDIVVEECEVYCEYGRRRGPWVGAR